VNVQKVQKEHHVLSLCTFCSTPKSKSKMFLNDLHNWQLPPYT